MMALPLWPHLNLTASPRPCLNILSCFNIWLFGRGAVGTNIQSIMPFLLPHLPHMLALSVLHIHLEYISTDIEKWKISMIIWANRYFLLYMNSGLNKTKVQTRYLVAGAEKARRSNIPKSRIFILPIMAYGWQLHTARQPSYLRVYFATYLSWTFLKNIVLFKVWYLGGRYFTRWTHSFYAAEKIGQETFHKRPDSKYIYIFLFWGGIRSLSQLLNPTIIALKAAIEHPETHEHSCIPIKLYGHKLEFHIILHV